MANQYQKQFFGLKVFTGLALMIGASFMSGTAQAKTFVDILVPAYFYPGVDGNGNGQDDWKDMANAVEHIGVTAIMNPNSGSGENSNPDYVAAVTHLRQRGGLVIGYLSTAHGQRPIADLKKEIKNYIDWYKVDGFFFDEMPTTFVMDGLEKNKKQAVYKYYDNLFAYVNKFRNHSYVVGNPGNLTEEKFLNLPAADALITLENDMTAQTVIDPPTFGAQAYTPATWQLSSSHDATEFGLILHNVQNVADMNAIIDAGVQKGFGLYYVTDDVLPNPFDRLPVYWDAMVLKIRAVSK